MKQISRGRSFLVYTRVERYVEGVEGGRDGIFWNNREEGEPNKKGRKDGANQNLNQGA